MILSLPLKHPFHDSHSFFHRKTYIHLVVHCHPCPIGPVIPLNLTHSFDSSFATVMSEPALYILLSFHILNLISIFVSLDHLSKEFIQVWGPLRQFIRKLFLWRVVSPTPTPCQLSATAYSVYLQRPSWILPLTFFNVYLDDTLWEVRYTFPCFLYFACVLVFFFLYLCSLCNRPLGW
jgi:hypothetical protein